MKFRIALALGFAFAVSVNGEAQDRCPSFSGRFVIDGAQGQTYITINQVRCERIQISREDNSRGKVTVEKHDLKLDGKFQPDTPWLGSTDPIQVSLKFTSAALEIVARPAASADPSQFFWKALYVLRSNGDIEIRDFNRDTEFYEPVAIAVREP